LENGQLGDFSNLLGWLARQDGHDAAEGQLPHSRGTVFGSFTVAPANFVPLPACHPATAVLPAGCRHPAAVCRPATTRLAFPVGPALAHLGRALVPATAVGAGDAVVYLRSPRGLGRLNEALHTGHVEPAAELTSHLPLHAYHLEPAGQMEPHRRLVAPGDSSDDGVEAVGPGQPDQLFE
jgi:hypothetical protein